MVRLLWKDHVPLSKSAARKKRRLERARVGMCVNCHNPLSRNPVSVRYCEEHFRREREKTNRKIANHLKRGLCTDCNEPMSPDSRRWCEKHLIYHVRSARKYDAASTKRAA